MPPTRSRRPRARDRRGCARLKNLPDRLYWKLQARAKRQHRSVAQEVTQLLSEALEEPEALSILDLQGLGKEVWSGIDAPKHVEGERRSWD